MAAQRIEKLHGHYHGQQKQNGNAEIDFRIIYAEIDE